MNVQLDPRVTAVFDEIVARTPEIGPTPSFDIVQIEEPGRRARPWLALAAAAIAVVGGILAIRSTSSAPSGPITSARAPGDAVTVRLDAEALPPRDDTLLPLVATPTLPGWTIQSNAVALTNRFGNTGTIASYLLRSDGDQLEMTVSSGQADLERELLRLARPGGTTDAELSMAADGTWVLIWNERPGVVDGIAVHLSGHSGDQLLDVAASVVFVDEALTGADTPTLVEVDTEWRVLFTGTFGGVEWSVVRGSGDDGPVIVIDGQSPLDHVCNDHVVEPCGHRDDHGQSRRGPDLQHRGSRAGRRATAGVGISDAADDAPAILKRCVGLARHWRIASHVMSWAVGTTDRVHLLRATATSGRSCAPHCRSPR